MAVDRQGWCVCEVEEGSWGGGGGVGKQGQVYTGDTVLAARQQEHQGERFQNNHPF